MGRREENIKKVKALMTQRDRIRNIGIIAHIDHGKTTLSDNLLAGAGMISEEYAGKMLVLDYDEQEQARGITIQTAAASMVHEYDGKEYLINLLDTPGHVDFGGEVTRAMRACDGVILVVDAVEGVMPQTETVIRQALRENVKPVLFINKVDRLINELKLPLEKIQERFAKIIKDVNNLIKKFARPEFKEKWQVRVTDGSVAFGSAYHNWAISVPFMEKTGIKFKDIYEYASAGKHKELAKKAPITPVVLDMVVRHLPSPLEAQKYRIPVIWRGDVNSDVGKAMLECDPEGPLVMMVTKIIPDRYAGEVAVGRIYSGTIRPGQEVYVIGHYKPLRVQQVAVMVGPERIPVDELTAGNVVAITGVWEAYAGATISNKPDVEPFEEFHYVSEPVVTIAIEAKNPRDLPKLVEVLRRIAKADPSLRVEINQETGEHLLSGMGELHLEVTVYKIENEYKVPVKTSQPIVVYRESVLGTGGPFEGKSPNRHNRFYIVVEPLEEEIYNAIRDGTIPTGKVKDSVKMAEILNKFGWDWNLGKSVVEVYKGNMFLDVTVGIQYLNETMELILDGFRAAMDEGPLAKEPVMKVKVKLVDAKLHEDAIHRGPAQVIPAVKNAIYGAMLQANAVMFEPMFKVTLDVPMDYMGAAMREIQQRRGSIISTEMVDEATMRIVAKAPVAEMFGFANAIRSATQGRAIWNLEFMGFEKVPDSLQMQIIQKIRERKGLPLEPPTADDFKE